MNTTKKAAFTAGLFYLISYLGVIVGAAIVEPMINAPDALGTLHQSGARLMVGVLFEILNGVSVIAIAVALFPTLKRSGEGIALGYVCMRVLEGGMQVAMDFPPLSLVALSKEYLAAGMPDPGTFRLQAAMLLAGREIGSTMLLVFFALGAVLLYVMLYRSELVPRFISVWGLIAVVLVVAMNVVDLGSIGLAFALPIITNELFLAIWLMVKGFAGPAVPRAAIAM